MSPKEVIAASKGAATETTLDQRKGGGTKGTEALLQAPYASGKFQFRAMFNFSKNDHRLAFVSLQLLDPSLTPDLIGNLKGRYGEPTTVDQPAVMTPTLWRGEADQVTVIEIGTSMTSLRYHPT